MSQHEHYVEYQASKTKLFLVDIPNGDNESVKKFLEKYPKLKFLHNDNKESAAAIALKFCQIEIYETLLARGSGLGVHENVDAVTQNLDRDTKKNLREIHKKYLIDPKLDHLTSLLSKCKLHHGALESEYRKFFGVIAKSLMNLNEIEAIEPILKVVSCSDQLKIVFDFYQNSVQHMVPAASRNTDGTCFHVDGCIYVAAESHDSNPQDFLGVLAHEMCHYAMYLVYKNHVKPYKTNSVMTESFENILMACEAKKELEQCIASVFDEQKYPNTSVRHAELIVRVPQLMALYKEDTERLEELKLEFRELFEFYEVEVLSDLERHYKMMLSSNRIKEINDLSGLSTTLKQSKLQLKSGELNVEYDESRISIMTSNCVELTMVAFYNKLISVENFDSKFVFLKADALLNNKMFKLALKAFSAPSKPVMIIDGGTTKVETVVGIIMKLRANQINERVFLVIRDDSPIHRFEVDVIILKVTHCWNHLSPGAKKEASERPVALQGKLVPLKYLIIDEKALGEISLRDLFEEKVAIGADLKFDEIEFHLPRKFEYLGAQYEQEEIVNILRKQLILLSENPGMGKTTEFKMLTLKIKENLPSNWVVFVDLKKFVSAYQSDGKVTQKFENQEQITKYFCDEILKIEGFEAEVFKQLFKMNRVVFLLDGFDEISPSFKEFNLSLIRAITRESENQMLISTRPHLEKEFTDFFQNGADRQFKRSFDGRKKLPTEATVNIFKLVRLTRIEKEKFLRRKLKSKSSDAGKIGGKLLELMQVIDKLEEDDKSDSSPLLLQLFAEICVDDSKFAFAEANFYSIYEVFTQEVMNNYVANGSEAKEEVAKFLIKSTDIMSCFYQKAFEVVFGEGHEVLKLFENAPKLSIERMARIGFVSFNSKLEMEFVHRTFAEFFVADCLMERIFLTSSKKVEQRKVKQLLLPVLKMILVGPNYPMLTTFIYGAIKTCLLGRKSEKIKNILQKILSRDEMYSVLFRAIVNGHTSISIIIKFALPRKQRERNLGLKTLYSETFLDEHALWSLPLKTIKEEILLAKKLFHESDYKSLFDNCTDEYQGDIFHIVACNSDPKVLKFLMKSPLVHKTIDWKSKNSFGQNVLMISLGNPNESVFEGLLEYAKKQLDGNDLKKLLLETDNGQQTVLHKICYLQSPNHFKIWVKLIKRIKLKKCDRKEIFCKLESNGIPPIKANDYQSSSEFSTSFWKFFGEFSGRHQ